MIDDLHSSTVQKAAVRVKALARKKAKASE